MEPFKQGDRPPNAKENPGSPYRQRLGGQARPRAYSRYIHVKQNYSSGCSDGEVLVVDEEQYLGPCTQTRGQVEEREGVMSKGMELLIGFYCYLLSLVIISLFNEFIKKVIFWFSSLS